MNNCQVFTPDYIVELMLNQLDYEGNNIKSKTIFEPSFGDGAFLVAIVKRIMNYSIAHNLAIEEIHNVLDNVYGAEIDKRYYDITIQKLNNVLSTYGIKHIWKNLICDNTLHYISPVKFDLIIANPPYQKIQHLDLSTRNEIETNYKFGIGNTDLYVVFFEHCLRLINKSGKLCFITPNSYFKNSSQSLFRKHLSDNNLVQSIIDYSNVKVFGTVATYTAIILLDFAKNDNTTEYTMMRSAVEAEYQVSVNLQLFGGKPWVFTSFADAQFLNEIAKRPIRLKDLCDIQHGIATNADRIYIVNKNNVGDFEDDILRPITKASTLNAEHKIIFPYMWNSETCRYEIISEYDLKQQYPKAYEYLSNNRIILNQRDMDRNNTQWYQYARSQGIQNSNNKKIALKHIISDKDVCCEIKELDNRTLVYSGIYIVVKDDENYDFVKNVLLSEEFHKYLFLVGKNMAGGYRSVSAKFVKEYGIKK